MSTRLPFLVTVLVFLTVVPASAAISGYSTASNCGEAGNWLDITFTAERPVTLVAARWDFEDTVVWLDPDGDSLCGTVNDGLDSVELELIGDEGQPTQQWGITATGFDSGDSYRYAVDLDVNGGGSPFTSQYLGGLLRVEFSDGTTLHATFDTAYDEPNGARAHFAETGPNLTFADRTGWYAPVVPRPDNTATWTSVPAPATLTGDQSGTWFSAVCYNDGTATALPTSMVLQVDGATVCQHNLWTIEPGLYNGWTNDGSHTVRGGRHTVVAICDVGDNVDESDETDNVHARQWIWEPVSIGEETVTRSAPPEHDAGMETLSGGWWNCDGVRVPVSGGAAWDVIWMDHQDDPDAFYCLRLHPEATGPEDGFGTNVASTFDDDGLDALVINTYQPGLATYDVGVLNFEYPGDHPDYRLGHLGCSPYPFDFGIFSTTPYSFTRVGTFDFFTAIGELGAASLVAVANPAHGPVKLGHLPADFTVGSVGDLTEVTSTGERGWAVLNLDLATIGHHAAVVWGDPVDHPGSMSVRVGLFGPLPDLYPATMTGWYAPIVPRPDPDAALFSCGEPDTLHGNGPWTWLNTACVNGGTVDADTVSFSIRLDGLGLVGIRNTWTPLAPGLPRTVLNLDHPGTDLPWTVPGGRHTLSVKLDYLEDLAELLEENNLSGRQYCWSPQVLPLGGVLARDEVPERFGGHDDCEPTVDLYPNCDGLRLQYADLGDVGRWRAVAVMPDNAGSDVDLELHRPLQGATDGFGPHKVATSVSGPGEVELALVCYRGATEEPLDAGVLDTDINQGVGYTAQDALSSYLGEVPTGELGPFTLLGGRMLELHELWLPAGPVNLRLDDLGAGVDWGLSVYRASGSDYRDKTETVDGGFGDGAGAGGSEWLHMDLPAADHYCVAVWKRGPGDLATTAPYRLWLTHGATGAPVAEVPAVTRLLAARPNPFNPRTVLSFDLATPATCRLVVHDLAGRAVRRLVHGHVAAGQHEVPFDGRDQTGRALPSGVYVARLESAGVVSQMKLTLVQ